MTPSSDRAATPTITRELVEALEEARPYVETYCQEHGATGTLLQAKLVALLAKIDAALDTPGEGEG